MRSRFYLTRALASVVVTGGLVAGACGGSPSAPPPVVNTPPVIESLTIAPRAEADRPLQITATVKDTETPISQLTYTWSASPQSGTFSGNSVNGSQALVTWQPPKGQKTPDLYTVTLTVSEAYTSAGQAKQNVASSSGTVHYNDSPVEANAVAYDFLVYKFGNINVSPAEVVSNFSDSTQRQPDGSICSDEKANELNDVTNNRENFEIRGALFIQTVTSFNSTFTNGIVDGHCQFEDVPKSGPNAGRREFVSGTCHLTTVYENFRWLLCVSNFDADGDPVLASLRGRVPGRPRR
jgi:hypothetical protein